jgi:hypothetical protein
MSIRLVGPSRHEQVTPPYSPLTVRHLPRKVDAQTRQDEDRGMQALVIWGGVALLVLLVAWGLR